MLDDLLDIHDSKHLKFFNIINSTGGTVSRGGIQWQETVSFRGTVMI